MGLGQVGLILVDPMPSRLDPCLLDARVGPGGGHVLLGGQPFLVEFLGPVLILDGLVVRGDRQGEVGLRRADGRLEGLDRRGVCGRIDLQKKITLAHPLTFGHRKVNDGAHGVGADIDLSLGLDGARTVDLGRQVLELDLAGFDLGLGLVARGQDGDDDGDDDHHADADEDLLFHERPPVT